MKNPEANGVYRIITAENRINQEPFIKMIESKLGSLERVEEYSEGMKTYVAIGDTESPLTARAKEMLEGALSGKSSDTVGYAICREGDAYAIYLSDPRCSEGAVEHFIESFPEAEGVSVFPLISYLREHDERVKGEAWERFANYLGEEYGKEIAKEMKDLYSLFDDGTVSWLANLYDPKTGGFYWSNSGRDTVGFLPSIEETYAVTSFVEASGMARAYGDDWTKALPDYMKEDIKNFFVPLECEDTFFYNPQWPKDYITENNRQSRITRDRGTARRVLGRLGVAPKYTEEPKKTEEKKDDAPRMMWQFESVENFKKYIDGLEADYLAEPSPQKRAFIFYSYGNLFQSTAGYLNSNPEFKRIFLEFFSKYQNKETGMWSEVLTYDSTNSMHKIGSVYNSIGERLEHIDKIVESVMTVIGWEADEVPASGGVNIYNAWSCLPYLYKNILLYGEGSEEERKAKKDEIKRRVLSVAAKNIRAAKEQLRAFKREDGGFSYNRQGAATTAQGCPIALSYSCESDINGNSIAILALKQHIFMALEAKEYDVPVYGDSDLIKFMSIIENIRENGAPEKKRTAARFITSENRIKLEPLIEKLETVIEITDREETYEEKSGTRYVVLGESDARITERAKSQLAAKLEGREEGSVGYVIHREGTSYAIYASDPRCTEAAIDHFVERFPAAETVKVFPLMPYLKERGEKKKEKAWAALEEHLGEYGEEIVTELKKLYALFDPASVLWVANLFDPESGLWYFSNSARGTLGYLPSIEETYGAICFPEVMGMFEMIKGGTKATLPEWVQERMANSIIAMQDEDTFFYNPQWPKEYIVENKCQPRITRDKASALWILRSLGREPKYADKAVVEKAKKGDSAPRVMTQFESVESFRAYLDDLEAQYLSEKTDERRAYKFYEFGNLFQSVIPYVKANPEYKRMLIEFFEKYKSPNTGVWTELVCFNAVNAVHKIGAVYNALEVPLSNIDKMIDMVMKVLAITPEEYQAYSYIDIYNIWSCFPYLYKNIVDFGEGSYEERIAKKNEIKRLVFSRAAEAIKISYAQVEKLRQPDGAFSNRNGATPFTMGCPVAVPDVKEGNTASIYSLTHHIFMAFEALGYEVPYCTEYDRAVFVSALEEIGKRGSAPKKKADYRIICEDPESEAVKGYAKALSEVIDVTGIYPDTEPRIVREIVIGRRARDTAEEAYRKLESRLGEDEEGYVIYFTGRMVIAYTDPKYIPEAIEHIVSHYPAVAVVKSYKKK